MSGTELRQRLDERIEWHQSRANYYRDQLKRPEDSETEDDPLLPEHILENERDEHLDRVEELTLIRDHLETAEKYLLGETDLKFGELIG